MQLLPTQKVLDLGAGVPGPVFCAGPLCMPRTLDHAMTLSSQRMRKRIPIHCAWHPASTQNMLATIIALISSSPKSSNEAMSHCLPMCQMKGLARMLSQDRCPGFILAHSLPAFPPELEGQAPRLQGAPQVFRGADCNSLHMGAHVRRRSSR